MTGCAVRALRCAGKGTSGVGRPGVPGSYGSRFRRAARSWPRPSPLSACAKHPSRSPVPSAGSDSWPAPEQRGCWLGRSGVDLSVKTQIWHRCKRQISAPNRSCRKPCGVDMAQRAVRVGSNMKDSDVVADVGGVECRLNLKQCFSRFRSQLDRLSRSTSTGV